MRKIFLLAGILCISLISVACTSNIIGLGGEKVVGSGNLTRMNYDFENFREIDSSNTFKVIIEQSDNYSIEIETDDNVVEFLDVREDGERLMLDLVDNKRYRDITLIARISVPDLKAIYASGASDIEVKNGLESKHDFEMKLSGASYFDGDLVSDILNIKMNGASGLSGNFNSKSINIDIAGASSLKASGETNDIVADLSGASDINMYGLRAKTLSLKMSGSSRAEVNVEKSIDVKASGASTLKYKGDAKSINKELSGSSDVINKN